MGAHEWISTTEEIILRMFWRFSGRNITGSSRFWLLLVRCFLVRPSHFAFHELTVMRSVFDAGDGVIRGGKSERSSERGVRGVVGEERLLEIVPVCSGGSTIGDESMIFILRRICAVVWKSGQLCFAVEETTLGQSVGVYVFDYWEFRRSGPIDVCVGDVGVAEQRGFQTRRHFQTLPSNPLTLPNRNLYLSLLHSPAVALLSLPVHGSPITPPISLGHHTLRFRLPANFDRPSSAICGGHRPQEAKFSARLRLSSDPENAFPMKHNSGWV